jgi:serine/threonine-protein phosphatase 2A catalytic subunit
MNFDKNINKYKELIEIFSSEKRLIRLKSYGKAIFVGDTHGDFDASKTIIEKYLNRENTIIFLGDYVDRGPASKENIYFLMDKKLEFPDRIYLLMGNHESYCSVPFSPADFWESITPDEQILLDNILRHLPYAVVTENKVIGVHGVVPEVDNLEEINNIKLCSKNWYQLVWGDFVEDEFNSLYSYDGRPKFGEKYFKSVMEKIGMNILIRSHQPRIKTAIFDKRCLTIITSYSYTLTRLIAIVDLEKTSINSINDIVLTEI